MAKVQWERKHQEWLVQWFRLQYPDLLIVASANGGKRDIREAVNLKKAGVLAGFPDVQVFKACRGFNGLLIELKDPGSTTRIKGKVSMLQKIVLNKLNAQGYHACVCWGFEAARDVVRWYLGEDNAKAPVQ